MSILGELFVTAAAILALFFCWQVFYTDITAGHVRDQALSTWREGQRPVKERIGSEHRENFPVAEGEGVLGVLHVPRWGDKYEVPIVSGTDQSVLDSGQLGHYDVTQSIGDVGNAGLAGHRTTFGRALREVHALESADALIVETTDAWLVYRVVNREIVLPSQYQVLDPVPPFKGAKEGRYLTLTTCNPIYGNTERYIVWAEADYWTPKSEGMAPAMLELRNT